MPDELTIASTTESQAALNHAMSDDWEKPFIEPETEQTESADESANGDEESAEEPPKPPKERGESWRKRVDKLTRRSHEQQAEIDRLREQLSERASSTQAAEKVTASEKSEGKPDPLNFAVYEDYVEAVTDWKIEQRLQRAQQDAETETQQEHAERVFGDYKAKLEQTKGRHADFDDVMESVEGSDVQIPTALQPSIIEADNGPEIAYYLAKNPKVAAKLCEMTLAKAAVEIGRISASLPGSDSSSTAPKKPGAAIPKPINPVSARASASTAKLDELSFEDFKKRYQAGER